MSDKAIKYNLTALEANDLTGDHIYELVRYWQAGHDLVVDGWAGPVTRSTIEALWPEEEELMEPVDLDPWDGPLERQPDTRKEVYDLFGNPGSGTPDRSWERASIVECHPRYGNQLPGVPGKWYVKVHKLVEPYLREGLRRAALTAPAYQIERLGCYVFRHQRHDSDRPLSYHSWGIAIDIDPHFNYSKRVKRGTYEPWSDEWMKVWPKGLSREMVDALKSCGWSWGGDWPTYKDPMHFQWVGEHQV